MPLFWLCLAFIIGVSAAPVLLIINLTSWILLISFLILSLVEFIIFHNRQHPLLNSRLFKIPFALLVTGFFLGNLIFNSALPNAHQENIYHFADEADTVVIGRVISDPEKTTRYTTAVILSETIRVGESHFPASGKIRVTFPQGIPIAYGTRLKLQGELQRTIPDAGFPYQSRDGQEKIFSKMNYPSTVIFDNLQGSPIRSVLFRLRERANAVIFDVVPFPESTVLSGILLGIESSIPSYLWNGYRASGIAHIIVISGFNISLIAVLLFRKINRAMRYRLSLIITLMTVCLYTILVGADTPVVRAATMAAISLPAAGIGRKSIGIHSLVIAAALMLAFNPFQLWNLSFQLSFLATLALLVMSGPISSWIIAVLPIDKDKSHPFIEIIIPTLCASFVIFPILFRLTGTISFASIPANILVAPLQPFIMGFGGMTILVGLISPLAARVFGSLVWPLVAFCNQVALRLSIHPSATKYLPGWVYPVSLICVILILSFFSVREILVLMRPLSNQDPE